MLIRYIMLTSVKSKALVLCTLNEGVSEPAFRPFYIVKIPHSNLLLVVVENAAAEDQHAKFATSPQDIVYEGIKNPCQKLILNDLERRRLAGCYNEHPMVSETNLCI